LRTMYGCQVSVVDGGVDLFICARQPRLELRVCALNKTGAIAIFVL
jgi:hypothetical protein